MRILRRLPTNTKINYLIKEGINMSLVSMKEMLIDARAKKFAVGAFEFWSLDSAQAVCEAAQELNVPVILQAGYLETAHCHGFDKLRKIAEIAAGEVDIPVALHLDHAEKVEDVKAAIESGFTSVMIDASHDPYEVNVEKTCKCVEMAHPLGISVESELGILAGNEAGIHSSKTVYTEVDEAVSFVKDTDVDCLAVAIGTAHGLYTFKPEINIERLKEIEAAVSVPLVLHGGSGTPDDKVCEAIKHGIAKINICTEFIQGYGKAYSQAQAEDGFKYNVTSLFGAGKEGGKAVARAKISMFKTCKTTVE